MNRQRLIEIKRDLERGGEAAWWPSAAVDELVFEIERLYRALESIAEYDVRAKHGYVDEWTESKAYDEVCQIAERALGRKRAE